MIIVHLLIHHHSGTISEDFPPRDVDVTNSLQGREEEGILYDSRLAAHANYGKRINRIIVVVVVVVVIIMIIMF